MMPILRTRSIGVCRDIEKTLVDSLLPAVMGKGAVGVGHAMGILALFDRAAAIGAGLEDFGGEPLYHRFLAARACRRDHPAHRERIAPHRAHFARHLIIRAADAP